MNSKHHSNANFSRSRRAATGRGQSGFTLLEVLVAMLVLAVGLLGVAAMQLRGLQYNHDAYLRSQISVLAYDIADRMRLNSANAANYVGNYTVTETAPSGCVTATVSAANDLTCWRTQVHALLPLGASAEIAVEGTEFTTTLAWNDRDGALRDIEYTFIP